MHHHWRQVIWLHAAPSGGFKQLVSQLKYYWTNTFSLMWNGLFSPPPPRSFLNRLGQEHFAKLQKHRRRKIDDLPPNKNSRILKPVTNHSGEWWSAKHTRKHLTLTFEHKANHPQSDSRKMQRVYWYSYPVVHANSLQLSGGPGLRLLWFSYVGRYWLDWKTV